MPQRTQWSAVTLFAVVAAGCGGDDRPAPGATAYKATALVSDGVAAAAHVDAHLVNPWGIAFEPTGDVWVANNGTQSSTLYNGAGVADPLVVALPQTAGGGGFDGTGIVTNTTGDFAVPGGGVPAFIYSGEGGALAAWVSGSNAVRVYDDGAGGAVYKGLAVAASGGANFLYAADFHNSKIDVFDHSYAKAAAGNFAFADAAVPAGYAPFGIQNVGGKLVVTYAQQKAPGNRDEVDGLGLGYVAVFNADGTLARHLASGGALNAPWGIALAPAGFGDLGNTLLVGNFGDGRINAYDFISGASKGAVRAQNGAAIVLPGLWGIAFGNGYNGQPATTLFYAAGINDEADGEYGRIDASGTVGSTMCGPYGC